MGKYSSDSEHEKRCSKRSESHKSSRRRRSTSSSSTESRYRRGNRDKHNKRSHKSRSGSRDRYYRSRRSESSSRSSTRISSSKYRSYRRSRSKSRSKDRDRERDRDRHNRLRRSRSRSYIREYTSRPSRKRSSSTSDSTLSSDTGNHRKDKKGLKKDSTKPPGNGKLDRLSSAKLDKQESDSYNVKEEIPQFDTATLDEINSDDFAPKPFYSDKKPMENIVINLKDQTIKVPETDNQQSEVTTSLFHHDLFANEEYRMQKWVKELYIYRQKALQQGARRK